MIKEMATMLTQPLKTAGTDHIHVDANDTEVPSLDIEVIAEEAQANEERSIMRSFLGYLFG